MLRMPWRDACHGAKAYRAAHWCGPLWSCRKRGTVTGNDSDLLWSVSLQWDGVACHCTVVGTIAIAGKPAPTGDHDSLQPRSGATGERPPPRRRTSRDWARQGPHEHLAETIESPTPVAPPAWYRRLQRMQKRYCRNVGPAPVGATVFSTPYKPDRMRRLAGPYRWQASSHPDLCRHRCRHECASSLWERACPRWRRHSLHGKPARAHVPQVTHRPVPPIRTRTLPPYSTTVRLALRNTRFSM